MTEEQIVKILTETRDAYQKAIEEMPEERWFEYLQIRNLEFGICNYIQNQYDVLGIRLEFIVRYIDLNSMRYQWPPIHRFNTYQNALDSLKHRRNYIDKKVKRKTTSTMLKNVNKVTIMINPNSHIGVQLKKAREEKGFTAPEALEEYNKIVPAKKRVASVVSYYQKERRDEIGITEICAMMKAIGINNILIDDYGVSN